MSPEHDRAPRPSESRRWPDRVQDIITAAEEIQAFIAGHTLASFSGDAKTVKAVLADIAIIGEAVVHIPESARRLAEDVP